MKMTRTSLLALVAVAGCGDNLELPFDHSVEAADVSILYPLPDTLDPLIQPSEEAAFGQLFPEPLFPVAIGPVDVNITYGDMRLIALRVDPCSARKMCNAEVRAIFQPVLVGSDGKLTVGDGAIHVFYGMEKSELVTFQKQIQRLKLLYGGGIAYPAELGPQPILVANGLGGDYARELHQLVLQHLGESRIERFTERNHQIPGQDRWDFYLFERIDGNLVRQGIATTSTDEQQVTGTPADPAAAGGIIVINPVLTTPVVAIVDASRPAVADDAVRMGFAEAIELQDPTKENSESIDCVSCHLAEGGHRVGVTQYGLTPTGAFQSDRSLAYERDLRAITDLHMFAYDGRYVSVAQRVANESAVTSEAMQALVK
jgi:hypothetical protein